MEKIPLILVLGFLGSGKTSFIKHLVRSGLNNRLPALVQNEFAPAGIDAEELVQENENLKILEINGGSVFCVCRIDNFIPGLADFITTVNPGIIIVEASGISDPMSLAEILTAPSLQEKIYYSGAICLIDSRHFSALRKINQRVQEQVRIADMVLLNKTDLTDETHILAAEQEIRVLNPSCEIRRTIYGHTDLQPEQFLNSNSYYITGRKGPSGSSGLKTAVIRSVKKISQQGLQEFLRNVQPHTLRMKGFVNLDNNQTVMVQSVADDLSVTGYENYIGPTQLIAIGETLNARDFSMAFRNAAGST